jgi:O-antigen/teichoic acid export membrane protein
VSFIRDSAYSLAARAWMALARGACVIALSRALGPADYGVYALVLNTFVIAVMVGTAGLEQASTWSAGKDPGRVPQLLRNAVWLSGGLGAVAVLLFVGVAAVCRGWLFDPTSTRLILGSLVFVPLAILNNQLAGLVVGCGWFRYYAKSETFKWTAYLGLSLLLLATHRLNVASGLLAFYASTVCTGALHGFVLWRRYGRSPMARWRPDLSLARQLLAFGGKAFGVSAVNLLNFRFDLYMVKYFRSPSDVGMYSLGMNLAEVLLYCARSVNLVLFSRISSDERRSTSLTPAATRVLLAGITFAVFCILLVKDPVVLRVFGERYAICSNVVTLLLPGILAQSLSLLLVGDMLGKQQLGTVMRSAVLCFTIMVALDLAAIPLWGVLGAAAISTLAYASQAIYLLVRHSRAHGQQLSRYLLVHRADLQMMQGRLRLARQGAQA